MANFDIIVNAVDKTRGTFQGIERSLKGIQGLAAGVGSALAGAFTVKQVVDAASAYQKLQVSLTGAVGAAKSGQVFTQLNDQASQLGVSVDDLTGAFKNLKSTGLDTSASSLEVWTKLAVASGTTVENIADAIGNAYQGSFGKISKATNDLIEVENKYGQFVVRIGGQVKATVANTGQVVNVLKQYVDTNKNYTDALKVQAQSIDASYKKLGNAVSGAFSTSGLSEQISKVLDNITRLISEGGNLNTIFSIVAKGLQFLDDNFKVIATTVAVLIGGAGLLAFGSRLVSLAKFLYTAAQGANTWASSITRASSSFVPLIGGLTGFTTKAGNFITYTAAISRTVKNAGIIIEGVFTRAILNFGLFSGGITGVIAGVTVFGSTILKIAGILLRFIGGPWGLLISGILLFQDEIMAAGRKFLEFIGILDKPVVLKVDPNKTEETFKRLGIQASNVQGGRGSQGGPTAQELADYNKKKLALEKGDGKPADTYLAELIGNFGKARRELDQLQAAMKNTTDINLLNKMFDEASSRAEQFGIVLQKPNDLIGRDFKLNVEKSAEALRIQQTEFSDTVTTLRQFNIELDTEALSLAKQNLLLVDSGLLAKKFANEVAAADNSLTENAARLASVSTNLQLYNIELAQNAISLDLQEQKLGFTAQTAQKFAQELRGSALALKENALKLADANYQQGLFNQSLTSNQQAIEQQKITIELLNKAFADGTIGLQEYAALLGNIDARLIGVTETTRKALDAANATVKSQDNSTGAVKDLTSQLRAGTITWRQYEAAVKNLDSDGVAKSFINVTREIERAKSMAEVFAETLDGSVRKAGDALADSLTEGIMKGKLSLNSFKDFFGSILNDIAAMIIKKQFVSPIVDALTGAMSGGGMGGSLLGSIATAAGKGTGFSLGGVGDWFSSAWGGISDFFGGFFADGGYLPAGQFGIAGEAGPELITGPANIVPMDKLSEGNQPTPIVNFTINAIDTQTGVEFLMKNKPQIIGMVQQGFNSQGKRGIYR